MSLKKFFGNKSRILIASLALVVIAVSAMLVSTSSFAEKAGNAAPKSNAAGSEMKAVSLAPAACEPTTWNLTAGQTIDVGSVIVSNDSNNLYVTYQLDYPNACFGTLHLWAGSDIQQVPAAPNGNPIPGQFPYQTDATGSTSYTFTIPLINIGIENVSNACGVTLYVVTHAEVDLDCTDEDTTEHETAFGGPTPGTSPRWWFYGDYKICCGSSSVPFCTTAYAKGGYVWTTDKKSNPENLPSLNLTKNRWGWAINLTAIGTTQYPIWLGAGLNNTGVGKLVGILTINWDGTNATITYNLNNGYFLEEVHVYAGDGSPKTIAPGQYGYLDYFNPKQTSYEITVPLADTNATGGVWVVAHANVCNRP